MKDVSAQIEEFQKELNDIQRNYDRAKGRYQSYLEGLKKSFNVKSLAEAKALLKETKESINKSEADLEKAVGDFERNYL